MFRFPELPDVPASQRAEGPVSLRYEDISQDGRLLLQAVPHGLGEVVFAKALSHGPVRAVFEAEGIVPILTRLVVEGFGGPIAVRRPLEGAGRYELAHVPDGRGGVARIVLNIWLDVFGPKGLTYGPPPEDAGKKLHLGRIFAEHAFTRPFGPPGNRKVLDLPLGGARVVPETVHPATSGPELLVLPEGAVPLDDEEIFDDAEIVFGLGHTDSNQHVNSLVYPELFEQAALRRFAARGRSTLVLARNVDLSYRKPCFAGDRMRIRLRSFALGDGLGAVGAFVPAGDAAAKPHAWARIGFRP
jgi:hypothetical protein